ncbi:ABC transporter substrate-binding protein [Kineococcus xinjiangensis]|uniref:ABC transporter substrate-binding protein n=1 Tax=Kineococcus xinjiangensis TaxID=512762 RepID=UPI000CEC8DAB
MPAAPVLLAAVLALSACAAPDVEADEPLGDWSQIQEEARGQTVSLWMWGGDPQGNAYVDDVLAPAAAELGVTLRRVPVADTKEALNRILAERQAGRTDGEVDLVWVNGENFRTGRQAGAWRCGWTSALPNAEYLDPGDPLLGKDFGTDVDGCEAPWHKAQFTLVYDSAKVPEPPTTFEGVLDWAEANPGRFTYPAPPDFTGSVFVRQALYSVSGGHEDVPLQFDQDAYDRLTPPLWERLRELAPSLWREGRTYPRDSTALDELYAGGEVDMTMTYGPATLTSLVEKGTFPATTRVLPLEEGTVGNASFLAIPATSPDPEGAMVVANLAMSPEQQAAKAHPDVWGQFTVLDEQRLDPGQRAAFEALPDSPVVPPYPVLARGANPELAAAWVPAIDEGWRRNVLAAAR